jgi:hypothetical protein
MQNPYLQEKLAEGHRQELIREAEQRRLVAQVHQQPFSLTRRCLGTLGKCLVMLGTRLKELETSSKHAVQQL